MESTLANVALTERPGNIKNGSLEEGISIIRHAFEAQIGQVEANFQRKLEKFEREKQESINRLFEENSALAQEKMSLKNEVFQLKNRIAQMEALSSISRVDAQFLLPGVFIVFLLSSKLLYEYVV